MAIKKTENTKSSNGLFSAQNHLWTNWTYDRNMSQHPWLLTSVTTTSPVFMETLLPNLRDLRHCHIYCAAKTKQTLRSESLAWVCTARRHTDSTLHCYPTWTMAGKWGTTQHTQRRAYCQQRVQCWASVCRNWLRKRKPRKASLKCTKSPPTASFWDITYKIT